MADYTGQAYYYNHNIVLSCPTITTVYKMRAYDTISSAYIYWNSKNTPDALGLLSGIPNLYLDDIVVVKERIT